MVEKVEVEVQQVEYDVPLEEGPIPMAEAIPIAEEVPTSNSSSIITSESRKDAANYFVHGTSMNKSNNNKKSFTGALLSETHRSGKFTVPSVFQVGSVLGQTTLDFSLADFCQETTTIQVHSVLGEVKIVVPRGVRVEMNGMAILGEFKANSSVSAVKQQESPVIRVQGASVLASVKVKVNQTCPPVNIVQ